jgi:integrase
MSHTKQAKVLSKQQVSALLHYVSQKRRPERNRVIVLLSVKAGLRAKEIALLRWSSVLNAEGQVGTTLDITNETAKGNSGRVIPTNRDLRHALVALWDSRCGQSRMVDIDDLRSARVIDSSRSQAVHPQFVVNLLRGWYSDLGFFGASSHSGRRTFITNAAKKVFEAGGSLRDVQQLAGHKSLAMTQRYIEGDAEAKRKLVDLV